MTITLVSVVVALLIGGIETLGLMGDKFGFEGGIWRIVGTLNDNFNNLSFAVIGVFIVAWVVSYLIYRVYKLDRAALPGGV